MFLIYNSLLPKKRRASSSSISGPGPLAVQPSSSLSSTSSPSTTPSTTSANNTHPPKKRKNVAPALNIMRRKRIRPTLIDDRVAIAFFRELRLTREWINSGTLLAWALSPSDPDFINIHDYVERGQSSLYGVKILSILRIIPKVDSLQDADTFFDFNLNPVTAGKHRMMLWHGTKVGFVPSILQTGLKLPQRYGFFGKGIYFADRVANSLNYCSYSTAGHGYLFLCDVLLDKVYEAYKYEGMFFLPTSRAPRGTNSVKGTGREIPDPAWNMKIDGCTWPLGPTVEDKEGLLYYNEYIIYDQTQVQPKYLIKFEPSKTKVKYNLY